MATFARQSQLPKHLLTLHLVSPWDTFISTSLDPDVQPRPLCLPHTALQESVSAEA